MPRFISTKIKRPHNFNGWDHLLVDHLSGPNFQNFQLL